MENMRLPIALVGVLAMQLAGGVWWVSQQAATIETLTEDIEVLTAANDASEKTNLIRDVEQNSENIEEMIDVLVEWQEEFEEADKELWDEVDNMVNYFTQLVQLQARVKTLENTLEYLTRTPNFSDGR
jgi:uncharacterized protein HemX|tara:strand:+ start:685 stop:1068 length:384 start_codon:yes stop_codon:yes gene_type:complete